MRSQRAKKRIVQPDNVYKSRLVARFINIIMWDGKKSTAENIVYTVLEKITPDKKEALKYFEDALRNLMPKQEVRSRRVGGATYQVPMPVKHERSEALAVRWLITAARAKSGKDMIERLFKEVTDAHDNTGAAVKTRDDNHKMAEANKAFSHFRF